MPRNSELICTFSMVDAVSPILRVFEALVPLGSDTGYVMPDKPIDVLTMPGSTDAVLVPSMQLIALLAAVAEDVRQTAYAAHDTAAFAKLTPSERQNRKAAN